MFWHNEIFSDEQSRKNKGTFLSILSAEIIHYVDIITQNKSPKIYLLTGLDLADRPGKVQCIYLPLNLEVFCKYIGDMKNETLNVTQFKYVILNENGHF
jgi:hypothetical protein